MSRHVQIRRWLARVLSLPVRRGEPDARTPIELPQE